MACAQAHEDVAGTNRAAPPGIYFLSPNQERVALSMEIARRRGLPIPPQQMVVRLKLSGHLQVSMLEAALAEIIKRHSSLRTVWIPNPSIPELERRRTLVSSARAGIISRGLFMQELVDTAGVSLHRSDLRHLSAPEKAAKAKAALQREISTPSDEQKPFGLRAHLLCYGEHEHILLVTIDHRVCDGWAIGVIRREIEQLYRHLAEGGNAPRPPAIGFVELCERQTHASRTELFAADLRYWAEHWQRFGGARLSVADLPFATVARQQADDHVFNTERVDLSEEDVSRVRSAARRFRVTLYSFFLAALLIVLRCYLRRHRLALWWHCANRTWETMGTVGWLAETHLMGFELPDRITIRDLMAIVSGRHLETMKHEQMPLLHLWETLQCVPRFRDCGMILDYQVDENTATRPSHEQMDGALTFSAADIPSPSQARFASLGIYIRDTSSLLHLRAEYQANLYPAGAVVQMLADLTNVAVAFTRTDRDDPLEFPSIAHRYSKAPAHVDREMDEFIVLGSHRIPGL